MAVYKDEAHNTWYTRYTYKDETGIRRYTTKRGFSTREEALDFEKWDKKRRAPFPEMMFSVLVEEYLAMKGDVRPGTTISRDSAIRAKILPYFGDHPVAAISDDMIRQWQDELTRYKNPKTGKSYSKTYLRTLTAHMRAIMNYAVSEYGLSKNPVAKNMGGDGCSDSGIRFWTVQEYKRFALAVKEENPAYHCCFEILFWAGVSEGEALALTPDDIDIYNGTIFVSKTFQSAGGKEIIGPPRCSKAFRNVRIPDTLCQEIESYVSEYGIKSGERLFPFTKHALNKAVKRWLAMSGAEPICVDDLRHSHIIMLIRNGFGAEAIAERTGHEGITIARKYAEFFTVRDDDMAAVLETEMRKET